jgi:RNA recognition motif-containing protein
MSTTVHVEGISSQTTEKEVRDFFSFCGKISDISVKPTSNDASATKSATVTFEKETAAKTALLLDNTQLGPSQVTVKSTASLGDLSATSKAEAAAAEREHDVDQEDKPRSRIIAEYLAHG